MTRVIPGGGRDSDTAVGSDRGADRLRMMPTSPRSPYHSVRRFPQYGWQADLSDGAVPSSDQLKPAPGMR